MKIDSYLSTNIVNSVRILMIFALFFGEKLLSAFMYFGFSFFHMILWQFLFDTMFFVNFSCEKMKSLAKLILNNFGFLVYLSNMIDAKN